MKKTCMCTLLSVLLVSWCCLSMGCASTPKTVTVTETVTEVVTETEYVPVYMDLSETIDPVLSLRPDNSKITIKTNPKTTFDLLYNSWSYQSAWEKWQVYAETLEQTLRDCVEIASGKSETNTISQDV